MTMIHSRTNRGIRMHTRRGVVAVKVAILSVLLIGFAALGVDVGVIYNARLELQRSVNAAALAGAAALANTSASMLGQDDPRDYTASLDAAVACALQNPVTNQPLHLAEEDVEFGWAERDTGTSFYSFDAGADEVNAVRVTGRRTGENAQDGPIKLIFARIFGLSESDAVKTGLALMRPRDIAVVADLSASHNDDSELRNVHNIEINLGEVWAALPGGVDDSPADWPGWDADDPAASGWAWGVFQRDPAGQQYGLGFGYDTGSEAGPTLHIDKDSYNPNTDNGLIDFSLPDTQQDWVPAPGTAYGELADYLTNASGYKLGDLTVQDGALVDGADASEIYAIFGDHTSTGSGRLYNWVFRTAVATGYAEWYSGIPGGKWENGDMAAPPFPANGDDTVDGWEVVWGNAQFGDRQPIQMAFMWFEYALDHVSLDDSAMVLEGNSDFRWKIGPKTFTNYLMEVRPQSNNTPELASTPHQPVFAQKQAVAALADALLEDYHDLLSLAVYATTVSEEVELTSDYDLVPSRLTEMQAAHYNGYTNIGGGIRIGRQLLYGPASRPNATKVLVLLSDGKATAWETLTSDGPEGEPSGPPTVANTSGALATARAYALAQADWAGQAGVQIYAVSLGADADLPLMDRIAEETNGRHFHVEGDSIAEYTAGLIQVFEEIALIQPVTLIQ